MSREAFEKWFCDSQGFSPFRSDLNQESEEIAITAWQAWQAAKAQAVPIAAVRGYYNGMCVVDTVGDANVLPAGMALYSQPQAQAELEIIYDDNGCPTEVRIAQAQAGDGEAVGRVYYTTGDFLDVDWYTSDIPDDALLYTRPQPAQVNQQLLEALQDLLAYVEQGIGDIESDEGRKARAAIAAAQEQGK